MKGLVPPLDLTKARLDHDEEIPLTGSSKGGAETGSGNWIWNRIAACQKPTDLFSKDIESVLLHRCLGFFDVFWMGVGKMFGVGIFVLLGTAAQTAVTGPNLCLAYLISGSAAGLSVLVYAEFASRTPSAGGAYSFVYSELGEFCGWITGWLLLLDYAIGASTIARGWSDYFINFLELMFSRGKNELPHFLYPVTISTSYGLEFSLPTLLLLVTIGTIVACGIRAASATSTTVTITKISAAVLGIVVAFIAAQPSKNWADGFSGNDPAGGKGAIAAATVLFYTYVFFLYEERRVEK